MTVAELQVRISSRELTEWMAFYELEPFGSDAEYYKHGITASAVYNVHLKKGAKQISPGDFIPKKKKPQTTKDMIAIAARATQIYGGKDLRE